MLSLAVTFMLVAIVAAIFGFGIISGASALVAKICFGLFLILAILTLLAGRKIRL